MNFKTFLLGIIPLFIGSVGSWDSTEANTWGKGCMRVLLSTKVTLGSWRLVGRKYLVWVSWWDSLKQVNRESKKGPLGRTFPTKASHPPMQQVASVWMPHPSWGAPGLSELGSLDGTGRMGLTSRKPRGWTKWESGCVSQDWAANWSMRENVKLMDVWVGEDVTEGG